MGTQPWAMGLGSLLLEIIFKVTKGPLSVNFKHQQLLQLNSHLRMKLPLKFKHKMKQNNVHYQLKTTH